jgi:hypothetical protein
MFECLYRKASTSKQSDIEGSNVDIEGFFDISVLQIAFNIEVNRESIYFCWIGRLRA